MKLLLTLLTCLTVVLPPQAVKRIVDGDTFVLHNGDDISGEVWIRVAGIDVREVRDSIWYAARDSAGAWLARGSFTIHACRRDSFGRLLAWVSRPDGDSLHIFLLRHRLVLRAPVERGPPS